MARVSLGRVHRSLAKLAGLDKRLGIDTIGAAVCEKFGKAPIVRQGSRLGYGLAVLEAVGYTVAGRQKATFTSPAHG